MYIQPGVRSRGLGTVGNFLPRPLCDSLPARLTSGRLSRSSIPPSRSVGPPDSPSGGPSPEMSLAQTGSEHSVLRPHPWLNPAVGAYRVPLRLDLRKWETIRSPLPTNPRGATPRKPLPGGAYVSPSLEPTSTTPARLRFAYSGELGTSLCRQGWQPAGHDMLGIRFAGPSWCPTRHGVPPACQPARCATGLSFGYPTNTSG